MKIVVACDSFKGSLTSREVGETIAQTIREIWGNKAIKALKALKAAKVDGATQDLEIEVLALADGGEGTVEAILATGSYDPKIATVSGPHGEPVEAKYARRDEIAVIETASVAGLTLLSPEKRNPETATTRGLGELILHAYNTGCRKFMIGLGGSATCDAGIGMLAALGGIFLNKDGEEVSPVASEMARIDRFVAGEKLMRISEECKFTILSDVNNPLYGPKGAANVFAPQKGADADMVHRLDEGLHSVGAAYDSYHHHSVCDLPGAGAAGGLGAAFLAVFERCEIVSGAEYILDRVALDLALIDADLVITGEGKIDGQTMCGKLPSAVARRCAKAGIPVIAICGTVDPDLDLSATPFTSVIAVKPDSQPLSMAMKPDVTRRNICTALKTRFPGLNESLYLSLKFCYNDD